MRLKALPADAEQPTWEPFEGVIMVVDGSNFRVTEHLDANEVRAHLDPLRGPLGAGQAAAMLPR
jgi:hypothetical protein